MMFCCKYYFMFYFNATISFIIPNIFTAICCNNINQYCCIGRDGTRMCICLLRYYGKYQSGNTCNNTKQKSFRNNTNTDIQIA